MRSFGLGFTTPSSLSRRKIDWKEGTVFWFHIKKQIWDQSASESCTHKKSLIPWFSCFCHLDALLRWTQPSPKGWHEFICLGRWGAGAVTGGRLWDRQGKERENKTAEIEEAFRGLIWLISHTILVYYRWHSSQFNYEIICHYQLRGNRNQWPQRWLH